jgi:hypothetical protein
MPIVHRTNNRVLPPNARAVDVAKDTLRRIIPVQNRKYDAAFQVNGYSGVLYNRLSQGYRCACCREQENLGMRLGLDGKADPGTINELLSGGQEFGIRPYGTKAAMTPQYRASYFEIEPDVITENGQIVVPSLYDTDSLTATRNSTIFGSHLDRFGTDPNNPQVTTVVNDGEGIEGPVGLTPELDDLVDDVDLALKAHSDVSCPVCFGTGFVSGYSVFNGWRRSLVPYEPSAFLPADAILSLDKKPPQAFTPWVEWKDIVLPMNAVGVDAVRIFMDDRVIAGNITVDGTTLESPLAIQQFCDGKPHTIRVDFEEPTFFSHLELQVNQSTASANFELPKTSKSSLTSVLENMEEIQVLFSPLISLVRPLDVVVESVMGKYLQITNCSAWNDNRASILGWEANLRPSQPQELFTILPVRRPTGSMNQRPQVRDNRTGSNRT